MFIHQRHIYSLLRALGLIRMVSCWALVYREEDPVTASSCTLTHSHYVAWFICLKPVNENSSSEDRCGCGGVWESIHELTSLFVYPSMHINTQLCLFTYRNNNLLSFLNALVCERVSLKHIFSANFPQNYKDASCGTGGHYANSKKIRLGVFIILLLFSTNSW